MNSFVLADIRLMMARYRGIDTHWDGRTSVLEMKEADYQWRQMEWIGFYFEMISRRLLTNDFEIPGERFGNTTFDMKRTINWDLKTKAIRSDRHDLILNDVDATNAVVQKHGAHGIVIALVDVEYNDVDRSFQQWHSELKGGLSDYELERMQRTSISRYRKTMAALQEVLFVVLEASSIQTLSVMRQGRNANSSARRPKYMLDLESLAALYTARLALAG